MSAMKADADRMQAGQRRPLTPGEIALGRSVFGDEIDWPRVRVFQAPSLLGFGAMVPRGRTIVFSKWRAARDFSRTALGERGWFVHELMHVWQAARGVTLAMAKLGALGKRAYAYKPRSKARLKHYNIERQAEIARHLLLARAGEREDGMPDREWLEDIWATR
ncbi:MAG: hypothetical protein R3C16_13410 [Hyphomonadaceae bacterium]